MSLSDLAEGVDHYVREGENTLKAKSNLDPATYWRFVDQTDAVRRIQKTVDDLAASFNEHPATDGHLAKRFASWPKGTPITDIVDTLNADLTQVVCGHFPRVDRLISRTGDEVGVIKNKNSRPCSLEGCTGVRMHVVWPDGKSTYPCTKGCTQMSAHLWKID